MYGVKLNKIKRDAVFWTACLQGTILNFFLGGFGPAQPLLRAEQGTSLTVAGLHGTMMGLAAIIAGFIHPTVVHKIGRPKTSWLGLAIFITGVPVFVLGPTIAFTLPSILFACIGFNFAILNMISTLTAHYPNTPDLAASQSNAINAVGYVIGTAMVGTFASFNLPWRLALLLVVPAAIALYFYGRDKIEDTRDLTASKQSGKLGGRFWIAWIGFFASISSEFATAFWAATLVSDRTGADPAISTLCIIALGTGFGIGRWYIPIWMARTTLDNRLKSILAIQAIAFLIFWLSHNLTVSLIALLFIGIGISGQFPMTTVRLIKLSGSRPDLAMAKSALAGGCAIGLAPFLLALLGDQIGISRAYLMVPVLIAISYLALILIKTEVKAEAPISR